jgi:hypothetical protein
MVVPLTITVIPAQEKNHMLDKNMNRQRFSINTKAIGVQVPAINKNMHT